jgi:hypothetical protein
MGLRVAIAESQHERIDDKGKPTNEQTVREISRVLTLSFRAKLWLYPGPGGWHFITLPTRLTKIIKSKPRREIRGWGSFPVEVTIGKTTGKKSIFPDSSWRSYVLPVKADVRKREMIEAGDVVPVELVITI